MNRILNTLNKEKIIDIFIYLENILNIIKLSSKLIKAIKVANEKKITVYALTDKTGGDINDLCECLKVPSLITGRIQESHILIGHIICGIIEKKYFT